MLVKLELKFGFVQMLIVRMSSPFFAKPNVIGSKTFQVMKLFAEMPNDYDWKPDKKYKNLWWKLLVIAGLLFIFSCVLFYCL